MFGMFPFLFNNILGGGSSLGSLGGLSGLTKMNPFMGFFNMDFIGNMVGQFFDSGFVQNAANEMIEQQKEYDVHMKEYEDYYMITGYLPGISPKDINIDFEKNKAILTINNKRTYSNGKNAVMTIVQNGGDLQKNFYIGEVDVANLAASFDDGRLILLIPKVKNIQSTVVKESEPKIVDVDSYKVE